MIFFPVLKESGAQEQKELSPSLSGKRSRDVLADQRLTCLPHPQESQHHQLSSPPSSSPSGVSASPAFLPGLSPNHLGSFFAGLFDHSSYFCIVFCIFNLITDVLISPSANLSLSMLATDASPALSDSSPIGAPGWESSAIVLAHARPKMTRSRRLLAPSLLAPWTELLPTSPAAYRPGTTTSFPSESVVNTCPR